MDIEKFNLQLKAVIEEIREKIDLLNDNYLSLEKRLAVLEGKSECDHKWIIDKKESFAYCEICHGCIKDGKFMTKEEYKNRL